MQNRILVLALFLAITHSWGQKAHRHNGWSRSEIGLMAGGSYYIGDLNQQHFKHTNLAAQLLYRYNINARLAYRLNFTYGKIEAYDSESKSAFNKNRNLSFQSDLFEFASGIEVTYFPFEIGNKRYKGTAYLLAELSLTRINPTTVYNGERIELQPLGTEGQGTELSDRSKYSRIQLGVPIAVGARVSVSKNVALNFEYGIRFLFTDYLDDVGGYRYADPALLAAANGPTATALSNRSLDGNRYGQRGNRASRDWYTFFGIGVMIRMGGKGSCPSDF